MVVEHGTRFGQSAWWYNADGILCPYRVVLRHEHTAGAGSSINTDIDWPIASNHGFVVLSRRSDGLYIAAPINVISNFTAAPVGWSWTYPINTVDGTDRFDASSMTDGLLGLPRLQSVSRDVDYACLRRRLAARLEVVSSSTVGNDTPLRIRVHRSTERFNLCASHRSFRCLRINFDMGRETVIKALAWAIATDATGPPRHAVARPGRIRPSRCTHTGYRRMRYADVEQQSRLLHGYQCRH